VAALRLLLALVLVAVATRGFVETDIWGHIRFGLDILRAFRLPASDSYGFTSSGRWINHEWASQVLFAAAYSSGGLFLLSLLRAGVVAIYLATLAFALRRSSWPLSDVLVAATILGSTPIFMTVRPQEFSLPLYALTLLGLSSGAWWLPLIFVVWANLHGGWLLGIGAVAFWTGCRPSRRSFALLTSCVVGTLVNPYGAGLWWSLGSAVRRGWADVSEWQPITVFSLGPSAAVIWAAACVTALWLIRRKRPSLFAFGWTVVVAITAFRVSRHVPFLVATVPLLLGVSGAGPRRRLPDDKWNVSAVAVVTAAAAICLLAVTRILAPSVTCLPPLSRSLRPESAAVQFIRSAGLRGRVLIYFDWGLYAIWHAGDQLKVSIDNRRETVYSDAVVQDHIRFYAGHDPGYASRLHADFVWLPRDLPPVKQLQRMGWRLIYQGPRSAILAAVWGPGRPVFGSDDRISPCFPYP
jgi:hypothetical protein